MPYGMTYKEIEKLSKHLSEVFSLEYDQVIDALDQLTRKEVARIARNEPRKEG